MIFYFTGTGNSQYVATKIAYETDDRYVSIGEAMKESYFEYNLKRGERLGFVVPTYYWSLPSIVIDFIKAVSIKLDKSNYVYAVFTCGASTGDCGRELSALLKKKGIPLHATFGIKMTDNYTPLFDVRNTQKNEEKNKKAEGFIDDCIHKVEDRESGCFDTLRGILPAFAAKAMYNKDRSTEKFKVSNDCIGCSLCAINCPCSAISLETGKPSWVKDECTLCFACLHHCPKNAISYGSRTAKHGQYVNSKI